MLVVRADLRGLAAARELVAVAARVVGPGAAPWSPLRPRSVPELVEESLGLPVLATVADESAVRLAAERGEPPSRSARSALAKACREVLDQLPRRAEAT